MSRRGTPLVAYALLGAIVLSVAWGALAFGAVYEWAYTPLAAAVAAIGLVSLAVYRRSIPPVTGFAAACAAIACAGALQLVPLPDRLLGIVSPGTVSFLTRYDFSYAAERTPDPLAGEAAPARPRPISIAPALTRRALLLFVPLALLALGSATLFSVTGVRPLALSLVLFGFGLAVFGIGQEVTIGRMQHMLVYGFWKTQEGARPFGPFINRNHFAGWMVMVIPLAFALMVERIDRVVPLDRLGVRDLLQLMTSSRSGGALLVGAAGVLLSLSVAMTESRSGVLALGAAGSLFAAHVYRTHRTSGAAKALAATMVVLMAAGVLGAGLQRAFGRFVITNEKSETLNIASGGGRIEIWRGSLGMLAASPLAGYGLDTFGTATIILQDGVRTSHWNEAHNDYLQLAVEGGLLVGVPALLAALMLVRSVRRRFAEAPTYGSTYWIRVGAVVGLLAMGVQSLFEFSLQMPGNAALFAVLVGAALHRSPNLRDQSA